MIRVVLKGHDNFYGLADILRLYCDRTSEDREGSCVTGIFEKDITLISEMTEDGLVATYEEGTSPRYEEPEIPVKRAVKRSLYKHLEKITGISFPWGCLTGIRPTLVADEVKDTDLMMRSYLVRKDKAELALRTARKENEILGRTEEDSLGVYVGIPFCPSRCEYCSFISQDATGHLKRLGDYLDALTDEISAGKRIYEGRDVDSLYIGGGTPTVFSDEEFERLIASAVGSIASDPSCEITVEAGRPDTITKRKLTAMKENGVGRICINPQTMNDMTLQRIGRRHTVSDIIRAYEEARSIGFETVNMDLIAGLKYETADDFICSVKKVLELKPENITVHTLYKKRRAAMSREDVLDREGERGGVDEALVKGYEMLFEAGYEPYYLYRQKDTGHGLENVGFSLPGHECRYNVAMMSDRRDVLSFGAGGMSKRIFGGGRLERCPCIKDITGYIEKHGEAVRRKIDFFGGFT
ncbi:MAG: coproporphyrinogen dehydrogenase HemZ [Clostridiales bacterium]|nr:coproporphyrinogen dehydrogenase HemZ [Clostridiales bacterium]